MGKRRFFLLLIVLSLFLSNIGYAQNPTPSASQSVLLGRLATGATVSFVQSTSGEWGIEISGGGAPQISQARPAQAEVFSKKGEEIRQLAAGYKSIEKTPAGLIARAELIHSPGVSFRVEDHWSLRGTALQLRRHLLVVGNAPG